MAPTEQACKNLELLFPRSTSTLAVADPEIAETFANFAFDEVLRESRLPAKTRLMVQLAAIIACQGLHAYRLMLGASLNAGVTAVEIKEILYQAIPYLGIAKVIDFIHVTNEELTARGIALPLAGQATTTPETRFARGLALQKSIVGDDAVDKFYASAPDDQQHIQRFLSANCFGDHVARSGLDVPMRELLTFSFLVAHGGCDPQVKGHVGANLHVGNDRDLLIDVATQLIPFIGYPRALNGLRAITEIAGS